MLRIQQIPAVQDGASDDFDVKINGVRCQTRACRVSAMTMNWVWPGHERPLEQTELASYISFECDETAQFQVRTARKFSNAVIRPLSKEISIKPTDDGTLEFTLSTPGFYVLELDDSHKALHIFFNAPEDYPEQKQATICYGPGVHEAGIVELHDNDSVYIDRDAVVYGAFKGIGAKHVRIFGQGVIDGAHIPRTQEDITPTSHGDIYFQDSSDIAIDGVILMNSPLWTVCLKNCHDASIRNVKIIGQWRYNSDGIDLCNSQDCSVEHCFIRAYDDVAVVKGRLECCQFPCRNLSFSDCVLWCDWGRTCEIGIETWATEFKNIHFTDCDLLHNADTALDVQAGGTALIQDVFFENMRVEFHPYDTVETYQSYEGEQFQPQHKAIGLLRVQNHKFTAFHQPYGKVDNIVFRNVHAYLEDGAARPMAHLKAFCDADRPYGRPWYIKTATANPDPFGKITLENITINQEVIDDIANLRGLRNDEALANLNIIK